MVIGGLFSTISSRVRKIRNLWTCGIKAKLVNGNTLQCGLDFVARGAAVALLLPRYALAILSESQEFLKAAICASSAGVSPSDTFEGEWVNSWALFKSRTGQMARPCGVPTKTVRGMKWARVAELEMELDGKKIAKYRTTAKIYFDIEK